MVKIDAYLRVMTGPETIDKSIIGTTRRVNEAAGTIDFTRPSSNGARQHQQATANTNQDTTTNTTVGTEAAPKPSIPESTIYRLHPTLERHKLIFQMGTASPTTAVAAARLVAADVAGIDVNAGCPKPFSVVGGMGAALLRTPDHLASILSALVTDITSEFGIGISVKIRLLDTPEQTEALVRKLVATGITGLTVHCRTTPMRPRERAIRDQLKMIAAVCREAGVACLMNGDVEDRDHAEELIGEFEGVDGAMIASAAEKNFSCFRSRADGGLVHWSLLAHDYLDIAMGVRNKFGNTKFLLAQMLPGKEKAAQAVQRASSYEDVVTALGFEDLLQRAIGTDDAVGITERKRLEREKANANAKSNKSKNKKSRSKGNKNHNAEVKGKKRALADEDDIDGIGSDRKMYEKTKRMDMSTPMAGEQMSAADWHLQKQKDREVTAAHERLPPDTNITSAPSISV